MSRMTNNLRTIAHPPYKFENFNTPCDLGHVLIGVIFLTESVGGKLA